MHWSNHKGIKHILQALEKADAANLNTEVEVRHRMAAIEPCLRAQVGLPCDCHFITQC